MSYPASKSLERICLIINLNIVTEVSDSMKTTNECRLTYPKHTVRKILLVNIQIVMNDLYEASTGHCHIFIVKRENKIA